MKQIVDKLNKIAKKIDGSVEIPQTDLIIDSLDAITKAYGGTPNDSHLIVDKLEDIAGVAHSGITPSGNIEITENTAEGEPLDVSQYATATVNVAGGGGNIDTIADTQTVQGEYEEPLYSSQITLEDDIKPLEYYPNLTLNVNGTNYVLPYDSNAPGYGEFEYDESAEAYMPIFTNYPFAIFALSGPIGGTMMTLVSNITFDTEIKVTATPVPPVANIQFIHPYNTGSSAITYINGAGIPTADFVNKRTSKTLQVLNVDHSLIEIGGVMIQDANSVAVTGEDIQITTEVKQGLKIVLIFEITGNSPTISINYSGLQ